jgi:hypothetical protein
MMSLFEKIKQIYPSLKDSDFGIFGSISLRNDADGRGDYIEEWNHPTLQKPTEEQLKGN